MNLMLNMKDINKILAKTHYNAKKSEKPPHFSENMSPCHAFTSPSCSLREKSSLPIFCKCGELCNIQIILLYLIDIRVCD
jgi:hypothetical protein